MRVLRIACSLVGTAVVVCGCTGLLGSFEVSNAGPGSEAGGPETSNDGAPNDALAPGDSGDATVGDAKPPPPPGTVLLAKSFGGTRADQVLATAVDAQGNIIMAGAFYSPDLDFGCANHASSQQPATGAPNRDSFVVKLDSTGACKWLVPMIGTGDDEITGVAVGANGNVFITGTTNSSAPMIGSTVVTTTPNLYQGYLARLDAATGNVAFVRRFGGTANVFGGGVSVSPSNLVVIGGAWGKGSATEKVLMQGLNNVVVIPSPDVIHQYGIVAVFDDAGEPQWGRIIKAFNNDSDVGVFKVLADAKDDILATGTFSSPGGLDPIGYPGSGGAVVPKNPVGGSEVFYMKIAGSGTKGAPVWTKVWASDNDIEPQGIAVDPLGNNAISFTTFGRQDLGAGDVAFAGNVDMAYGGYGSGGNYSFGNLYGGADQDFAGGIALAANGDRFITGGLGGVFDFGGGNVMNSGLSDAFVASFDKTNKHRWSVAYGSSSADYGRTITLGPAGLVMVAGFGGKLDVGAQAFDTKGEDDILLVVFQP